MYILLKMVICVGQAAQENGLSHAGQDGKKLTCVIFPRDCLT